MSQDGDLMVSCHDLMAFVLPAHDIKVEDQTVVTKNGLIQSNL